MSGLHIACLAAAAIAGLGAAAALLLPGRRTATAPQPTPIVVTPALA
ncbi:MAG TPA: hypothetical protein VGJ59_02085 [Jatrophihabitantaceae bacterium]|jgi:hypothetical protein